MSHTRGLLFYEQISLGLFQAPSVFYLICQHINWISLLTFRNIPLCFDAVKCKNVKKKVCMCIKFKLTVEPRHLELAYFELPLISKWKSGPCFKEQFLLFSTLFHIYISNFRSQITYSFVKCGCSVYCFPHSLNSYMSRYGYLEVFQWVPWNSR